MILDVPIKLGSAAGAVVVEADTGGGRNIVGRSVYDKIRQTSPKTVNEQSGAIARWTCSG